MQYSNKQVTGWKIRWKEQDRKKIKIKGRAKQGEREWVSITESTISKVICPVVIQAFIYTASLAAFYEICFLCLKFLHSPCISVSQWEKMIFRNTWLINVWSWNSDDSNFLFEFIAPREVPWITIHGWYSFILLLFWH